MSNNIKVSIIIPVYNTEEYLSRCLDTVCGQTLKELQIICVDDGSTDNSLEVLKAYREKDSRICILNHEHTGEGAALARNMGIEAALGEYLLILDSDDYFKLDLAEKAYKKAKETDADIVLFDAQYVDRFGRWHNGENQRTIKVEMLPEKDVFSAKDCSETLFQVSHGMAWSKLWKRNFIEKNAIRFRSAYGFDDTFFTFSAMAIAERMAAISEKYVYYRYNRSGNQSQNKDKNPCAPIRIGEELKTYLKEKEIYELFKASFWQYIISICLYYLRTANSFSVYKLLYDELRNGALRSLLDTDDWRDYFVGEKSNEKTGNYRKYLAKKIDLILTAEKDEFLYEELFTVNSGKKLAFPSNLVGRDENIIIYGAGLIGTSFFSLNMKNHYCKIVGWADQSYEEKGFPICAPDDIRNIPFDKVLIAIESENVAKQIKDKLIHMGIDERSILWQYPYE